MKSPIPSGIEPDVDTSRVVSPRALAQRFLTPLVERGARRLGTVLAPGGFYSPIPEVHRLDPQIWDRPRATPGIQWAPEAGFNLLESPLLPWLREFQPPRASTGDATEFYLDNGSYGPVDAETLYAMVRWLKPKRILELGAGHSTLVTAAACQLNRAEGHPAEFASADPYPAPWLLERIDGLDTFLTAGVHDVAIEMFTSLSQGDILFIDTTHTVKIDGDVNRLILEVLPTLADGVHVHFHDIFLPWEYPRTLIERDRYFWAEQYLLQALLIENPCFATVLATHHLARVDPDRLARAVPSFDPQRPPGSFWLRRRAPGPTTRRSER